MAPVRVRLAVCAAFAVGCGGEGPVPRLQEVTPARGFSDQAVRLILRGEGFVPSWRIDPASGSRIGEASGFTGRVGTGAASVPLSDFGWRSPSELSAWLERGLPAGVHPVEITDPRGSKAVLQPGFVSLGPDAEPPQIVFESPGPDAPIAPGVILRGTLIASEPEPGAIRSLRWEARAAGQVVGGAACALEPEPARVRCPFELEVPRGLAAGDTLELRAEAFDGAAAANRAERTLSLRLRARPAVVSLTPGRGGIAGGTDLLIKGSGFLPGTRAFLGDTPIVPNGGLVIDEQTLSGRAPARAAGIAPLVVRTPIGDATVPSGFVYLPPPQIESIFPESGDPDGGTAVRIRGRGFTAETRIYFGVSLAAAALLDDAQLVDGGEIRGMSPGGQGHTSVWAFEPELGWTRLADGFTWEEP